MQAEKQLNLLIGEVNLNHIETLENIGFHIDYVFSLCGLCPSLP